MFERPYGSAPPVQLNEDQSAVVRREVTGMLSALHHLAEMLAPGQLVERNLIYNILFVSESRLAQVGAITDVVTDSAEEQSHRNAALRTANERIRELERRIGSEVAAQHTKHAVAHLSDVIKSWWRASGLGSVKDVTMDGWGNMKVTVSCMLFGNTTMLDSNTPVSDKAARVAWLKSLEERGFVLTAGRSNVGHLVACDASRDALVDLITRAIPSAEFLSIGARCGRGEAQILSEATFCIQNLDDVQALSAHVDE